MKTESKIISKIYISSFLGLMIFCLSGCGTLAEKLSNVGKPPKFSAVKTYDDSPEDSYSMTAEHVEQPKTSNTLWTPNSRTFFFRDRQAKSVGDIIKVRVKISDKAKLDNKTTKDRTSKTKLGVPNLFGLESILKDKANIDPSKIVGIDSNDGSKGDGTVDRKETIETTIAVLVEKVLPNGNLLVRGTQEVRVNFELREVTVQGIVRTEDISRNNTVDLDQIAEARISYGGRGQITDYQQDKYGKQILDIISPF